MEAMEKLKAGQRFSEVATAYSEDKARQGVRTHTHSQRLCVPLHVSCCMHTGRLGVDDTRINGGSLPGGCLSAQHKLR